jgi:uncharacterized membrane protein
MRAMPLISSARKPARPCGATAQAQKKEETTMRKTVLTALGAALIAVATTQIASAHEHHHARKVEQFRNANNAVVVAPASTPEIYSGGWSAPAGR